KRYGLGIAPQILKDLFGITETYNDLKGKLRESLNESDYFGVINEINKQTNKLRDYDLDRSILMENAYQLCMTIPKYRLNQDRLSTMLLGKKQGSVAEKNGFQEIVINDEYDYLTEAEKRAIKKIFPNRKSLEIAVYYADAFSFDIFYRDIFEEKKKKFGKNGNKLSIPMQFVDMVRKGLAGWADLNDTEKLKELTRWADIDTKRIVLRTIKKYELQGVDERRYLDNVFKHIYKYDGILRERFSTDIAQFLLAKLDVDTLEKINSNWMKTLAYGINGEFRWWQYNNSGKPLTDEEFIQKIKDNRLYELSQIRLNAKEAFTPPLPPELIDLILRDEIGERVAKGYEIDDFIRMKYLQDRSDDELKTAISSFLKKGGLNLDTELATDRDGYIKQEKEKIIAQGLDPKYNPIKLTRKMLEAFRVIDYIKQIRNWRCGDMSIPEARFSNDATLCPELLVLEFDGFQQELEKFKAEIKKRGLDSMERNYMHYYFTQVVDDAGDDLLLYHYSRGEIYSQQKRIMYLTILKQIGNIRKVIGGIPDELKILAGKLYQNIKLTADDIEVMNKFIIIRDDLIEKGYIWDDGTLRTLRGVDQTEYIWKLFINEFGDFEVKLDLSPRTSKSSSEDSISEIERSQVLSDIKCSAPKPGEECSNLFHKFISNEILVDLIHARVTMKLSDADKVIIRGVLDWYISKLNTVNSGNLFPKALIEINLESLDELTIDDLIALQQITRYIMENNILRDTDLDADKLALQRKKQIALFIKKIYVYKKRNIKVIQQMHRGPAQELSGIIKPGPGMNMSAKFAVAGEEVITPDKLEEAVDKFFKLEYSKDEFIGRLNDRGLGCSMPEEIKIKHVKILDMPAQSASVWLGCMISGETMYIDDWVYQMILAKKISFEELLEHESIEAEISDLYIANSEKIDIVGLYAYLIYSGEEVNNIVLKRIENIVNEESKKTHNRKIRDMEIAHKVTMLVPGQKVFERKLIAGKILHVLAKSNNFEVMYEKVLSNDFLFSIIYKALEDLSKNGVDDDQAIEGIHGVLKSFFIGMITEKTPWAELQLDMLMELLRNGTTADQAVRMINQFHNSLFLRDTQEIVFKNYMPKLARLAYYLVLYPLRVNYQLYNMYNRFEIIVDSYREISAYNLLMRHKDAILSLLRSDSVTVEELQELILYDYEYHTNNFYSTLKAYSDWLNKTNILFDKKNEDKNLRRALQEFFVTMRPFSLQATLQPIQYRKSSMLIRNTENTEAILQAV
ncbi:MAG: hypothetical protein ABH857_03200, partial [Elusimicrobiota bacterium]